MSLAADDWLSCQHWICDGRLNVDQGDQSFCPIRLRGAICSFETIFARLYLCLGLISSVDQHHCIPPSFSILLHLAPPHWFHTFFHPPSFSFLFAQRKPLVHLWPSLALKMPQLMLNFSLYRSTSVKTLMHPNSLVAVAL